MVHSFFLEISFCSREDSLIDLFRDIPPISAIIISYKYAKFNEFFVIISGVPLDLPNFKVVPGTGLYLNHVLPEQDGFYECQAISVVGSNRQGLLYRWTEHLADFLFLNFNWGREKGSANLHPWGVFFGSWSFVILKNSGQDLSNEGSNFILSSLEVGYWNAQTQAFFDKLPEITDFGPLQQSQNRTRFWVCQVLT